VPIRQRRAADLSAIFIGLLFYPMARGRERPPLHPADLKRWLGQHR
jgi:hypothetical protein